MTFIEVVIAFAMFGVIAAALVSVMSATLSAQLRQQQQLAASELASRLILQWLDDPGTMPQKGKPIEYGPWRFRWDFIDDEPVRLVPAVADAVETGDAMLSNNRFIQLTAVVWLAEDSGGSRSGGEGAPSAVVKRLVDPIAFRNPDTIENMWNDPERRKWFFDRLAGFDSGGGGGGGGGGGRGQGGGTGRGGDGKAGGGQGQGKTGTGGGR